MSKIGGNLEIVNIYDINQRIANATSNNFASNTETLPVSQYRKFYKNFRPLNIVSLNSVGVILILDLNPYTLI